MGQVLEEVEVTDPCHPLFGRRFPVHTVTGGDTHSACVYVVYQGDHRLKIFREATNLSVLERMAPRSKLSISSIREFLALVKEYELCPSPLKKSGSVSRSRSRRKSSRKST
ncbi:hypothetical protein SH661x_002798 [Planctomicrobium sp. SH661]|uniref:hypothetical protein n=1 Tax=Planctomicrobium sp. SH661 TaxID=3448124 RepID=UPI003F5B588A